jgi:AcrR family transcriptional regulator
MRTEPLDDIESVPDPTALTGSELSKSRRTRIKILDSARDLLVSGGYAQFSTSAVAEGAGLTRPAMLYHFPSRQDLLNATIHYLARRRIETFRHSMAEAIQAHERHSAAIQVAMIDIAWDQVRSPEFTAFQELAAAARTDPELASVVEPAIAMFDRMRARTFEQSVPPQQIRPEDFQLLRDVVQFITEGAARGNALSFDRERRLESICLFLRALVASEAGGAFLEAVPRQQVADDTGGEQPGA